ncbi:hypothetical protein CRUP_005003 [Coryphaenoides rupestris]|nr:hypothetical protein CRUP_005003 [Coryphaenoides rupestris]
MALQSEADLTPALTCLKSIDALLRCPICFDFVSIAMMTKCSHNFCSLCIRKYLSYKLQCPVCNSSMTEQDLRNNRILDDLIISYQSARKELSKGRFDMPPLSPITPASTTASTPASTPTPRTPRTPRGPTRDGSILSHFLQKVPKDSALLAATPPRSSHRIEQALAAQALAAQALAAHAPGAQALAAHAPGAQASGAQASGAQAPASQVPDAQAPGRPDAHGTNASPSVAVKEEPLEEEAVWEGREETETSSSSSDTPPPPPTTSSLAAEQDDAPVIKVECPVCSVAVVQKFINKHLDTCLTRADKKESLRGSNAGGRSPVCKLVYNLLSLQGLKTKLRACHLSTQGPRDLLVRRHQEFVHAYNAQCDSLSPKSAEEIAKELEANEKTRTQLQGKAKPVLVFSKNQSEEEIDKVHSNYRSKASTVEAGEGLSGPSLLQTKTQEPPTAAEDAAPVSPTGSDVSISSSVSGIFDEDPAGDVLYSETTTPGRKRPAASRDEDTPSPPLVSGKRRRKT